jgi:predicted acylesterase/phospholipase RssA
MSNPASTIERESALVTNDTIPSLSRKNTVEHIVMQGGGICCFWQAGFLSRIAQEIPLQPKGIFAVSAAAGIACAFVADRLEFSVDWFKSAASKNPKNFYPENLFSSRPMFPHADIYRRLLEAVFEGEAFQKLRNGSEVHVLLARPPRACPTLAAVLLGALLFAVRLNASRDVWERVRQWSRFSSEYVSTRRCASTSDVADLILASSCTPPMTPLYRFAGRPSLDGGLLESVPRSALMEQAEQGGGRTLILMTKTPSRVLRGRANDVLVHPSKPLTTSPWDYTNPSAIDALVSLGRNDAEHFLRAHESCSRSLHQGL